MRRWFLVLALFCGLVRAEEPNLLDPQEAFKLSAHAVSDSVVELIYRIAPGYYLYRDKFRFATEHSAVALGVPEFPPGKIKQDEFFGKMETYRDEVRIKLPTSRFENAAANLTLAVTSQGCADLGVCFPPQTQKVTLALTAGGSGDSGNSPSNARSGGESSISQLQAAAGAQQPDFLPPSASPESAKPVPANAPPNANRQGEDSRIAGMLRSAGFWQSVAAFFVFGIGLALTPCVLPMLPILSGIIAGQRGEINKTKAFTLSAVYVLGMAITYAAAGVAAGLSGSLLAQSLQNPWVLSAFALIFVALALAMFGVYELQLPSALQSKLAAASNQLQGGKLAGVAAMGVLSALIVGPCVAAPLAGALLYISQTRDAVLGGAVLFSMALGMGAPLLALGISGGALLPKLGAWMQGVKNLFGVLLLGVAIWLVTPVISPAVVMLLWAALLIGCAMFLRAIDPLPAHHAGYWRLWKGVGIIALVAGIVLLVGALSGGEDPLRPLAGLRSASAERSPTQFQRIQSNAALDARLEQARGRYVLLDFYADWCVSCKEMERFTFSNPRVRSQFQDMVLLQADVTGNTAEDVALLKRFRLFGPPGMILFDREGREVNSFRVIGYQRSEEFLATLGQAMNCGTYC